jgi:hypothetical protein
MLGENYYLKVSGGPFSRNIYSTGPGIIVRLQFGLNYY